MDVFPNSRHVGVIMSSESAVHRLIVMVDMENYSRGDNPRQVTAQRSIAELLDRAGDRAGLNRKRWLRQSQGDGELAVLPRDADEASVLRDYVRALDIELGSYNRDRVADARIRLRVAMHHGLVHLADAGFAGTAINDTARLLDATQLRRALAGAPTANQALIVSAQLYDDVVSQNYPGIRPDTFRRVEVEVKNYQAPGWIHVPGYPAAAGADDVAREAGSLRPARTSSPDSETAARGASEAPSSVSVRVSGHGRGAGRDYVESVWPASE